MKKEYIILIAIIICLGAYLTFQKDNRNNYELPDIPKIDTAKVNAITIAREGETIRLTRQDKTGNENNWTVSDNHYPADTLLVENMLDTLKTFKLTALVSQTSDLKRYDLDPDKNTHVVFEGKDGKLFEFIIGKEAPSFNHTFVMLNSDKSVYHASGSFKNDFNKGVSDFRDTLILEVKSDAVKQFTVSKGKLSRTFIAAQTQNEEKETVTAWTASDKKPVDPTQINNLLATIAYLKCDNYVEDQSKKEFEKLPPTYNIQIDTGEKRIFSIFKPEEAPVAYGISTSNDYLFTLNNFDTKQITTNIETVLGIVPKKE